MKTSWKAITTIFADVMVSPWNLLVGGLLIKYLPTDTALLSIIIGYLILGLLFFFYGGLGLKHRAQSSVIIGKILGNKISLLFVPIILALGQIGWAGINIELGGKSLASALSLPFYVGIITYAIALIIMANLNLNKQGIVKAVVVTSSFGLIAYLLWTKLTNMQLVDFISYSPEETKSLLWGVSIVVASLISFTTVAPDFFQSVKNKTDVFYSTLLGIMIPGAVTAFLGCLLFFDQSSFDLILLVGTLTFPLFPHILNVFTNTDGAVAIFTPGLKIESLLKLSLSKSILIAGIVSTCLALLGISFQLEPWLKVLSLVFPAFIGVALAQELSNGQLTKYGNRFVVMVFSGTVIVNIITSLYFPAVIISLLLPSIILFSHRSLNIGHKSV